MYEINKDILWKLVDEEVVLVDPLKEQYWYLSPTGSDLWVLLSQGLDLDAICERLGRKYDASPATIESDVRESIAQWLDMGIIRKR